MKEQVARSLESWESHGKGFRAAFRFAAELPVFRGHFPGHPLVPGVFLIEAVRIAAERFAGTPLALREVVDARFSAPIRPGERIVVEGWWEGSRCEARIEGVARVVLDCEARADDPHAGC